VRVVDASVLVLALAGGKRARRALDAVSAGGELHAPHLVDVEVTNALRSLVLRGEISEDLALQARLDLEDMPVTRYPHGGLLERAWHLRHRISAYDGVYVALAELLDAPLLTADGRLARAGGHGVTVELLRSA
jgi:predicted nucleic acid-binding protein